MRLFGVPAFRPPVSEFLCDGLPFLYFSTLEDSGQANISFRIAGIDRVLSRRYSARILDRAAAAKPEVAQLDGAPLFDEVDGARLRHRDVPQWRPLCALDPMFAG